MIALVHHPLAFETGLAQTQRRALHASEKQALAHPRHVVVTSAATKQLLESEYEVHGDRISVVPPGTDRADPARGSGEGVVTLLAVGSVVPRKGYDILIAAMAMLKDMPCRLVVAGDRTRDPATASQLDADIQRHGLGEKVSVIGAVAPEALTALYSRADIFVLASRFEGYGMAFAEAIAHGLPVVATRGGALAETVPDGVGLLVPTDDAAALAAALRRLIEDRDERQKFAAASRKAALRLPTWVESGKLFAKIIEATA